MAKILRESKIGFSFYLHALNFEFMVEMNKLHRF